MRLELEITHRCNKHCEACSHRISTSAFDYLTLEEYRYLSCCIQNRSMIDGLRILGGEPLMHPQFEELMHLILSDFLGRDIKVWTNGKLLDSLPVGLRAKLSYLLSIYPGWNDEAVAKYGKQKNVRLVPCGNFWDPRADPNLSEADAKNSWSKCSTRMVRVVGLNLFGCCLADGVERTFLSEPVHVKFSRTWYEDWNNLRTWKACQHCFRAAHIHKYGSMSAPREVFHNHKFGGNNEKDNC